MELKIRNEVFTLTEDDRIFDNGSCFILMTQTKFDGWHNVHPTVSKTKCRKMIHSGKLVLVEEKYSHTTADGEEIWNRWYKPQEGDKK